MSMFRRAMVYLGLVDDDEYYGDDGTYYEGDAYDDAPERAERTERSTRASAVPAPAPEPSPVTVIRRGRDRDEPEATATAPRPTAVRPIPMPAARVHVMEPKGFNDAQEVGDRL